MLGLLSASGHRATGVIALGLLITMGVACDPVAAQPFERDFRPRRVLAAQPVITNFSTKPVGEANRVLNPSELVLGVTIGKESRAYPINMLTGPSREIINDQLGGQAIAATW